MQDAAVISIVDDDESSRAGTAQLVRALGFAARDFASARAFLQSQHVTETLCLIADVHMPDVNGIQLLDTLRALGHNLPTIFITAFPNERSRAEALSRGAICFLIKPFDGETLERCIKAALKSDSGKSN